MSFIVSPALRRQCAHRMPAERERELAARILAGDLDARNELVAGNLGLPGHFAKKYRAWGSHALSLEDLTQDGREGLVIAAGRFDPATHGTRFSTYASYWIRQRIRLGIARAGRSIRLPMHVYDRRRVAELGLRIARVDVARLALAAPTEDPLARLMESENRSRLKAAIARLSAQERELVRWWSEEYERGPVREPINARRNRAHAARQVIAKLREELNQEGTDCA